MRVQIADSVAEAYEGDADRFDKTMDAVLEAQLDRFKHVRMTEPIVILKGEHRDRLQDILAGGSLRSAEDLVRKVQALADLKIGGIAVDFTPTQWAQIMARADKNDRPLAQELHTLVQQIVEGFAAVV